MVEAGEVIELRVREQVVLQDAGWEARVREPAADADEGHELRLEVGDGVAEGSAVGRRRLHAQVVGRCWGGGARARFRRYFGGPDGQWVCDCA